MKHIIYQVTMICFLGLLSCEQQKESMNKNITMENKNYQEYKAIKSILQSYLESPNTAKATGLKTDWYKHLSVVGEINGHSLKMNRDEFIDLVENNEPNPITKGKIVMIDIEKNAACAKLEFFTPDGVRFTDYILLYKENGVWKASSKVFDTNIHYSKLTQKNTFTDYELIEKTLANYFDAAKNGIGKKIKTVWFEHAMIVGEYQGDIIKISRDDFVQAINHQGKAPNINANVISIDINGKAAYAKVQITDWLGTNYIDFLVLHKEGDNWLVSGKVYDIQ